MEPFKFIGVVAKAASAVFRRAFWLARMEDAKRLSTLEAMRDRLSSINKVQSRPENHRCIKYCYKNRGVLEDKAAIEKIESAHDMITRNKFSTFENKKAIDEICDCITEQIFRIDTK